MPNIDLELIANTSYALLLISYIMKDILWLRVLTVISLGFELPYFYFQSEPLWDGIGWDMAFIAINIYWIGRLAYDRRPVRFSADQQRLWQTALKRLHPRHARALFRIGRFRSLEPGEVILSQGDAVHELALISEGKVELRLDEKKVEELGPGHFVGTASFFERHMEFPTFATIVAVEPTRMITWDKEEMTRLIENDHQLSLAMEATLGLGIANLLVRAWKREASAG